MRPVGIEFLDGGWREVALAGIDAPAAQTAAFIPGERSARTLQIVQAQGPATISTSEIRRIVIQSVERLVVRSDAGVSTLHLGLPPNKLPEPANWFLPGTALDGWEPAVLQSPYYRWRYIPEACWIWAKHTGMAREGETVLFRQEFPLPATGTLAAAHLDLSADDQIEALFINGTPVPLPAGSLLGRVLHWDVTYLLRPGRNLIAARVTNLVPVEQLNYAGFCYRIVLELLPQARLPRPAAPAVRLLFANGDRLSGELTGVSSRLWQLRCGGNTIDVDTDWVNLAVMNYGAAARAAGRGDFLDRLPVLGPVKRLVGSGRPRPAVTLVPQTAVAWDESIEPVNADRGLLNRTGEWIEGRIESLGANHLQIKPRYGETLGIPLDRIALLQPNPPGSAMQFLFRPADFPAIVCVRLRNGDRVTGALESLSPWSVIVTPHFAKPIRFALDEVLNLDFVMNAMARSRTRIARAWPAQTPLQVFALGESESGAGAARDQTVQTIHRTLLNLGLEMRRLDAYQIVAPGAFTPERSPLAINLDQNERYYYAVQGKSDGFDAIWRYVEAGGTLAHFARGVPFAAANFPDRGRWKTMKPPRDLNAQLQLDILTPDRNSAEGKPFQLPPNKGQHLVFVLNRQSPFAEGLPVEVEIPMITDVRFRPVTDDRATSSSRFLPIYYLVDTQGANYGPAMAAVRYGGGERPHYGLYVSHLLSQAKYEDTPMIEYLLPKVIELTLGVREVSITNFAERPAAGETRAADAHVVPPAKPDASGSSIVK